MRDLLFFAHIVLGLALAVFPIVILLELNKKSSWVKPLSILTSAISWLLFVPAGILYVTFYPATKTLILKGPLPWTHSIIMETKEHWGILLPIIATVAAGLVLSGKEKESKKWWILLIIVAITIGVMGRVVKMGGYA